MMMRKWKYLLLAIPLVVSCSNSGMDDVAAGTTELDAEEVGNRIALSANVVTLGKVVSRADLKPADSTAYTGSPTVSNPLKADLWLSTKSASYPDVAGGTGVSADGNTIDTHRTIEYKSGGFTFPSSINDDKLSYPENGSNVYVVGLAPQDVWTTSDGTNLKATITGQVDLMYAQQDTASINSKFSSKDNHQSYKHLLTWLKIYVRAYDEDGPKSWGKIDTIYVKGDDQIKIDLKNQTVKSDNSASDSTIFYVWGDPNKTTKDKDTTMTTTGMYAGSLLMAPKTAVKDKPTFYVHIRTKNDCDYVTPKTADSNTASGYKEKRSGRNIPVILYNEDGTQYEGDTTGKVFVVNLVFKTKSFVQATVTLNDWEVDYVNLYPDS